MRLASAILAIIKKAFQAAAAITWRWCAASGKWIAEAVRLTASIPGALIDGLFGSSQLPPAPEPDLGGVDAVHEALEGLAERRRQIEMRDQMMRKSDPVGEIIHAYASASEDERLEMDLDALPEHVRVWLLTRNEAELRKLVTAGPVKCGRVANGDRCGIVGLKGPEPIETAAPLGVSPSTELSKLAARIAKAKGVVGRHPLH